MKKGFLCIIITTFLFSTMEIALKFASGSVDMVWLNFIRFLISGILLLPLAIRGLKQKNAKINTKDMISFAIIGFLGITVSMTLFQVGILYSQASITAGVFGFCSVFVTLFAAFFFKDKLNIFNIVSLSICSIGIIVMINPFNISKYFIGIIITIVAAIFFALYTLFLGKHQKKYGVIPAGTISFIFGSLEMIPFMLLSHIPSVATFLKGIGFDVFANIPLMIKISSNNIFIIAYVVLVITALAYLTYFIAIEQTGAATASIVFLIKPALAPVLAFIALHELIAKNVILGIILVVIGAVLNALPKFLYNDKAYEKEEELEKEIEHHIKEKAEEIEEHLKEKAANNTI